MRQKSRIPRKPQGSPGNTKSRYYYYPYHYWWWHNWHWYPWDYEYEYDYDHDWDYDYDHDWDHDYDYDYYSATNIPRKPKRSNQPTLEQAYKKGFSDGVRYAKEDGCEVTPEPTPQPPEKKE